VGDALGSGGAHAAPRVVEALGSGGALAAPGVGEALGSGGAHAAPGVGEALGSGGAPAPGASRSGALARLAVAQREVVRWGRHAVLAAFVGGLVLAACGAPPGAAVACALVAATCCGARPLAIAAAAAVLVGAGVGEARNHSIEGTALPASAGKVSAVAEVLEPLRKRANGTFHGRVRLRADDPGAAHGETSAGRAGDGSGSPAASGVAVLVSSRAFDIGELVRVQGRAGPLGEGDAYQRPRGARATLRAWTVQPVGRRGGVAGALDGARRRALRAIDRALPPEVAALTAGMALGQDEDVSAETRDAFAASGLAHILAVSGQNVVLLCLLVFALGAVANLPFSARLWTAGLLIAVYVPLTGAGPSIQRAGVMGAAGLVATLAGRPASRWYALLLAAAVTLTVNPGAIREPGWQLSFAAVAGLLAWAAPLRNRLAKRMPRAVAEAAAVTIAATVSTAPLLALHFEQVSLISLPANLVAAPAVAPVMWLGMLAAAVAQISVAAATPLAWVAGPFVAFIAWTAHTAAALPGAAATVSVGPAAVAALYAAMATLSVAPARRALVGAAERAASSLAGVAGAALRVAEPRGAVPRGAELGGAEPRGAELGGVERGAEPYGAELGGAERGALVRAAAVRRALPLALLAAAALAVLALHTRGGAAVPPLSPGETVVSFLDVGQGDATLIQRDGAAVLFDTGPPDGPILKRLAEARVTRLDALVITHAQLDHEGAAPQILRRIPTRLVLNGGAGWPSAVQRQLPKNAVPVHAGRTVRVAGLEIRFLWPPPDTRPEGDPNLWATVAHVRQGDFDLLLPADAESDVTGRLDLPPVEALKVAHHGSEDAGLPQLLERLRPTFAAIEVGRRNTYGHPRAQTLAALRAVPNLARTDRDGTVRLHVAHGRMWLESGGRPWD
jgi:competence protein ComEC